MATITLKDIPPELHEALHSRARAHGRSLNREAIRCLEAVLLPRRVDPAELLADIRRVRRSLPGELTDDLLEEATSSGRP